MNDNTNANNNRQHTLKVLAFDPGLVNLGSAYCRLTFGDVYNEETKQIDKNVKCIDKTIWNVKTWDLGLKQKDTHGLKGREKLQQALMEWSKQIEVEFNFENFHPDLVLIEQQYTKSKYGFISEFISILIMGIFTQRGIPVKFVNSRSVACHHNLSSLTYAQKKEKTIELVEEKWNFKREEKFPEIPKTKFEHIADSLLLINAHFNI